jgi:hypothetical protein
MTRSAPDDACQVEAPGQSWYRDSSLVAGRRATHEQPIENSQDRLDSRWTGTTKTSSLDAVRECAVISGSAEWRTT